MKKVIAAVIVAGTLMATPAQAIELLKLRAMFKDTVPTKDFAIEADGANPRGYAFDAPFNPAYVCIFVGASQKGGFACYPKADPNQVVAED